MLAGVRVEVEVEAIEEKWSTEHILKTLGRWLFRLFFALVL